MCYFNIKRMDLKELKCVKKGDDIVIMECQYGSLSGSCIYEKVVMSGKRIPIRQEFYVLTDFNMENIIQELRDQHPQHNEDIPMMVRNHILKIM